MNVNFIRYALVIALLGALELGMSMHSTAQVEENNNPYVGDTEAIAEGAQLYTMFNCSGCHGTQGEGGMGPSLRDEKWQIGDGSDANLLHQIMEGRANMPAYKDAIEEEQAWKLIAFIRTLGKSDSSTGQAK